MNVTDRRPSFFRAYEQAEMIISGIDAKMLDEPTPCPNYDVAALIDHVVGAGHGVAALGRGESSTGDVFPHVELTRAPHQLRQAKEAAMAAWSDASRLEANFTMPWGEILPGSTVIDMYLAELATHAWDLAASTDQLDLLDDDLAVDALEGARCMLKPDYRNVMGEGNPFGSEVQAAPNASTWESLAAFMGREPRAQLH